MPYDRNDSYIYYYNDAGFLHREDGPARIWRNGIKEWWINGKLHREDGPAVIWDNGKIDWWLTGQIYSFNEWLQKITVSEKEKLLLILKYR